jgi:hypothetical protein
MWAKQAPQVPGVSALASAGALTPPLQAACLVSASKRVVPVSVSHSTQASPLLLEVSTLIETQLKKQNKNTKTPLKN